MELNAGIATSPSGFSQKLPEIACRTGGNHLAVRSRASGPIRIFFERLHETVGNPYGVVRILPAYGRIGFATIIRTVASRDHGVHFFFFVGLPSNEFFDFRMVDIEANHFGRAP